MPDVFRALSSHLASPRARRLLPVFGIGIGALVLGGCQAPTFGAFRGATSQGHDIFRLWVGMFIAGLVVAVIVWGLIFWAIVRYRRRSATMPKQFQENLPLEITYTLIPIVMVAIIFYFTVVVENRVDAVSKKPAEIIHVLAYRWGWRFSYEDASGHSQGVVIQTAAQPKLLAQPATSKEYPQLVLPDNATVRIVLNSADVVHDFYVPEFNFGRYAQPGVTNVFDFSTTKAGVFRGQCSEYCGLYHSEMLFSVRVISSQAFGTWLAQTQASQANQGVGS